MYFLSSGVKGLTVCNTYVKMHLFIFFLIIQYYSRFFEESFCADPVHICTRWIVIKLFNS